MPRQDARGHHGVCAVHRRQTETHQERVHQVRSNFRGSPQQHYEHQLPQPQSQPQPQQRRYAAAAATHMRLAVPARHAIVVVAVAVAAA
eukprot:350726-Chlamydomonas_euryale.AAC.2